MSVPEFSIQEWTEINKGSDNGYSGAVWTSIRLFFFAEDVVAMAKYHRIGGIESVALCKANSTLPSHGRAAEVPGGSNRPRPSATLGRFFSLSFFISRLASDLRIKFSVP